MASKSSFQPSSSSTSQQIIDSDISHNEILLENMRPKKHKSILHRLFGNLHAPQITYGDELKQYSINGYYTNNKKKKNT